MKSPKTSVNSRGITDLGDMRELMLNDVVNDIKLARYDSIINGRQESVAMFIDRSADINIIRQEARDALKQYGEING